VSTQFIVVNLLPGEGALVLELRGVTYLHFCGDISELTGVNRCNFMTVTQLRIES